MFDIYLRKILGLLGISDKGLDADVLQLAVQAYRVRLDAAAAARHIKTEQATAKAGAPVVPGTQPLAGDL